jgi:hypothetical protein
MPSPSHVPNEKSVMRCAFSKVTVRQHETLDPVEMQSDKRPVLSRARPQSGKVDAVIAQRR